MLYMNNCSYMQTSTAVRRQDSATVQALADLFSILGDPTRVRIVRGRRDGRSVYYSLDNQHVLDLFQQGLRHVSEERR